MRVQMRRWFFGFAAALLVACGGGSSGGGGDGPPVIRAWLAAFAFDSIPSPGLGADGGSALLLVSISDVTAASAAGTVVEANGKVLSYDASAGAWRGWLRCRIWRVCSRV